MRASDGELIAVWDQGGEGVPVIFLHGFPQNHHCWHGVIESLAQELPVLRCITYDLRGHGESSKYGEASLQRFFHDHLDVVKALGIEKYHVVGHDWGGAVGLQISRYCTDQLNSLVILNTNYRKTHITGMWHMLFLNVPVISRLCFRWFPERMFAAFMMRSLSDDHKARDHALDSYQVRFHDHLTVSYWIRLYRNMAKTLTRQAMPKFIRSRIQTSSLSMPRNAKNAFLAPTTIIWGALDTFNPLMIAQDIKAHLQKFGTEVDLKIVQGAKHFVAEDKPAEVGKIISEHLTMHHIHKKRS